MNIIQVHNRGAILFRTRNDRYETYECVASLDENFPSEKKITAFAKRNGLRRRNPWVQHNWGREAILSYIPK